MATEMITASDIEGEAEQAGIVQPGEEKARGNLHCINIKWGGKTTKPDCSEVTTTY